MADKKEILAELKGKLRASEGKPGMAERVAYLKQRIEEVEASE